MSSNWINSSNFTFYNNFSSLKMNYYKNIVIFDLDNTIIKTKSGKTFPKSSDDWVFNYENVVNTINSLDKTIVGIISNQKGIKSQNQIEDWQNKMNNILKQIKFNFIFASFKDDRYRKPMTGSWQYIKDYLKGMDINKIIYVGDACGRETDHNDTDLKFAMNCEFKFNTPEKFFKIETNKQQMSITYPELTYYSKNDFKNILSKITENFNKDKILITFIGFPSCGKSFLRKLFINQKNDFKYNNKDDILNKKENINLINKHNENINYIIDDNTNIKLKDRENLSKIYKNHYKIGIYFDYDIDLANHLNYMRMFWFGEKLIAKVAYNTLNKHYEKPTNKEFDLFIKIDKLIPDFSLENNLKYYF